MAKTVLEDEVPGRESARYVECLSTISTVSRPDQTCKTRSSPVKPTITTAVYDRITANAARLNGEGVQVEALDFGVSMMTSQVNLQSNCMQILACLYPTKL